MIYAPIRKKPENRYNDISAHASNAIIKRFLQKQDFIAIDNNGELPE